MIRTTPEHPFYVQGTGWLPASNLRVGDLLLSHDGQWVAVEDLLDTGEWETVYNLRVADYHTYFVGSSEWAFSVWAHNACVYQVHNKNGIPRYVGIADTGSTSSPQRLWYAKQREAGLKGGVLPKLDDLHTSQARRVEEALIHYHGREGYEQGGSLLNKSASTRGTRYPPGPDDLAEGYRLLAESGYWNSRILPVHRDGSGI